MFSTTLLLARSSGPYARYGATLFIAMALSVTGCGNSKGPHRAAVKGEVVLKGEPLAAGIIRFIPIEETKGPVVFAKIRDGHYEASRIDGPVLGTHRVEIDGDVEEDPAGDADDPEEARVEYMRKHGAIAVVTIPDTYNRKSILRAVIEDDGDNTYDFELANSAK